MGQGNCPHFADAQGRRVRMPWARSIRIPSELFTRSRLWSTVVASLPKRNLSTNAR